MSTRPPGATGFPFSAVVGMDELRLALVLNAVSPAIGGVLVRARKAPRSRRWCARWPRSSRTWTW